MPKNEVGHLLHTVYKSELKMSSNSELLEDKMGTNLGDLRSGSGFLDMIPKAQATATTKIQHFPTGPEP
jgi:hypothetical protein